MEHFRNFTQKKDEQEKNIDGVSSGKKPLAEIRMLQYEGKRSDGKKLCPNICEKKTLEELLIKSPPLFSDLGKKAKDIFEKGYYFGLIKLNCQTKTRADVEFKCGGSSNQESGVVLGSLQTVYNVKKHGLTFSEKWSTDNKLTTEVSVKDQILKGFKLSANFIFSPETGSKSIYLKSIFTNNHIALNLGIDLDSKGPVIQAAGVLGHQGWFLGYQTAFDFPKSQITTNNFALGFSTSDIILHSSVDLIENRRIYGASIYHKLSHKLEYGVQISWTNESKLEIGAKYELDQDAAIRTKIDNAIQLGIGYQQRLREGVTLELSALIDGKNFNSGGGHKIGLSIELEA